MITYKVTMRQTGDIWLVMDSDTNEKKMQKALKEYRTILQDKKFRLEKHTMEVIDE